MKFFLFERGREQKKVLAILKCGGGGAKSFHSLKRGGGHERFYPLLRVGGRNKF